MAKGSHFRPNGQWVLAVLQPCQHNTRPYKRVLMNEGEEHTHISCMCAGVVAGRPHPRGAGVDHPLRRPTRMGGVDPHPHSPPSGWWVVVPEFLFGTWRFFYCPSSNLTSQVKFGQGYFFFGISFLLLQLGGGVWELT